MFLRLRDFGELVGGNAAFCGSKPFLRFFCNLLRGLKVPEIVPDNYVQKVILAVIHTQDNIIGEFSPQRVGFSNCIPAKVDNRFFRDCFGIPVSGALYNESAVCEFLADSCGKPCMLCAVQDPKRNMVRRDCGILIAG